MQEDFDKIRVDHLFVIFDLVSEFHRETGKYPFQVAGSELPVFVIIQTEEQEKTHGGKVPLFLDLEIRLERGLPFEKPNRVDVKSLEEFETELTRGLKRTVQLPKDPQKVPINKPSVYLYNYFAGVFEITAFLHHDTSFTRPIGEFYNKITLSNYSDPSVAIWNQEQLKNQEDFRIFFSIPFNKGGYTLKTEVLDVL